MRCYEIGRSTSLSSHKQKNAQARHHGPSVEIYRQFLLVNIDVHCECRAFRSFWRVSTATQMYFFVVWLDVFKMFKITLKCHKTSIFSKIWSCSPWQTVRSLKPIFFDRLRIEVAFSKTSGQSILDTAIESWNQKIVQGAWLSLHACLVFRRYWCRIRCRWKRTSAI